MNSTKHFTAFPMGKTKMLCAAGAALLAALAAFSLFTGKYPLTFEGMLRGDAMQLRVFWTLRAGRTAVGILGGFALGVAGYVYQTVFRNPLASRMSSAYPRGPAREPPQGSFSCPERQP